MRYERHAASYARARIPIRDLPAAPSRIPRPVAAACPTFYHAGISCFERDTTASDRTRAIIQSCQTQAADSPSLQDEADADESLCKVVRAERPGLLDTEPGQALTSSTTYPGSRFIFNFPTRCLSEADSTMRQTVLVLLIELIHERSIAVSTLAFQTDG